MTLRKTERIVEGKAALRAAFVVKAPDSLIFTSMCGRFSLATQPDVLARQFELEEVPDLEPRYNVAPSELIPVIGRRRTEPGRRLTLMRWGLIPFWAEDEKVGYKLINARAESLAKSMFAESFRRRRCLIPADGFYEWRREGRRSQPYHVRRPDGKPIAFAGLWERWRNPQGELVYSCTIVTTDANAAVRPVHSRMPVVLPEDAYDAWLDPELRDPEALEALLVPPPARELEVVPVTPAMNRPDYDDPENVSPIGPPLEPGGG